MKKNKLFKKVIMGLGTCLSIVLFVNANTATCYYFNQPEAPKGLDEFRLLK